MQNPIPSFGKMFDTSPLPAFSTAARVQSLRSTPGIPLNDRNFHTYWENIAVIKVGRFRAVGALRRVSLLGQGGIGVQFYAPLIKKCGLCFAPASCMHLVNAGQHSEKLENISYPWY